MIPVDHVINGRNMFHQCPQELLVLRHWVIWRYEARPGKEKPAKRPYTPGTGRPARIDVPATWGTWPQALARYQHGGWNGLGFVFTAADPYSGVDLDACRDPQTGEVVPWAWEIVGNLASYIEVSPSGRGLHILVKAELPDHSGRKHGAVEIYDHQRYFAVTGEHLAGTPATIEERQAQVEALYATLAPVEDETALPRATHPVPALSRSDAEVLRMALAAPNGAKFRTLWSGDLSAYTDAQTGQPDPSGADFALVRLLVYWTNGDAAQVDRLFRQSALYRPKWDKQFSGHGRTYGEVTTYNALRLAGLVGQEAKVGRNRRGFI
jgi:putative DNA primase/helicase